MIPSGQWIYALARNVLYGTCNPQALAAIESLKNEFIESMHKSMILQEANSIMPTIHFHADIVAPLGLTLDVQDMYNHVGKTLSQWVMESIAVNASS